MEKLGPGDPQRIGAYRLLARLGAGGMGQVYLARSDRGRTVAVKLIREELAAQEEFRARFRQEVQAARRVGGHWTAPVLDADTEARVPWVATGYVAGPSLQQVIGHDHGPLPERSVRILAAGLAHALGDIHAAGMVHRDLKPSNVMVTIDGPRVIDFGIARALETKAGDGLTRTGSVVGSPGFMSPEQVRGDRITVACDVFSLGSVVAYAATGRLPFGAANSSAHAQMYRIAEEEPDLTGVPEGLADLVRDCLRKDPAARPTLARILERTGAEDTVAGGRSRDPWLPGALVAQLGRHAVRLLDTEDPEHSRVPPPPSSESPGTPRTPGIPGIPRTPATPPAHPAYGYPQQHPQPGTWTPNPYTAAHPHPSPTLHYAPPPPQEPRQSGRSTALLVAIAVVVALAAGGSVYALMQGGAGDDGKGGDRASSTTTPPSQQRSPSTSPSASASSTAPATGAIPTSYLGTWTASIDNANGSNTRQLTIQQGKVGETVLTLVADGSTDTGGTYHCVFTAKLTQQPTENGKLQIGPSTVTAGQPLSSCTPGEPTEVTLLPNGTLRRARTGGAEGLTYQRE